MNIRSDLDMTLVYPRCYVDDWFVEYVLIYDYHGMA